MGEQTDQLTASDNSATAVIPKLSKESKSTQPHFLEEMSKDYPDLAKRVTADLPEWEASVDKYLGLADSGKSIADAIEYTNWQEIRNSILRWREELKDILLGDPNKRAAVISIIGGSTRYFANQVISELPEELRKRIDQITTVEEADEYVSNHLPNENTHSPTDYFIFDDSSNSGSQLVTTINSFMGSVGEEAYNAANTRNQGSAYLKWLNNTDAKKSNLYVRMLAMTDIAKKDSAAAFNYHSTCSNKYPPVISLDIRAKKMPETMEVLKTLQIPKDRVTVDFKASHAGMMPTVLGIFAHKIQDNLPPVLLEGKRTNSQIKPLFKATDIPKTYAS